MKDLTVYDAKDIEVGPLLGSGAFALVFRADLKKMDLELCRSGSTDKTESTFSSPHSSLQSFDMTTDGSYRPHNRQQPLQLRQALKKIKGPVLRDLKLTQQAFRDLHNEVQILSELPYHPNIVSFLGISKDFWTSPRTAFFLLERLVESLDMSLKRWKEDAIAKASMFKKLMGNVSPSGGRKEQAERIDHSAIGVARALAFLNEKQNIIFRDLKPANAGFDEEGNVRLFDFGLSRKLDRKNEQFKLTPCIGTPRYMAPEVAMHQNYHFPADVYSFGIFLWELCTLETPHPQKQNQNGLDAPVNRPHANFTPLPLSQISSKAMRQLLKECWSLAPAKRPSFGKIVTRLEKEVQEALGKKPVKQGNQTPSKGASADARVQIDGLMCILGPF